MARDSEMRLKRVGDDVRLVRVAIVRHEYEGELVCGLLRGSSIKCMQRLTNFGFVGGGEMPTSGGGAREILVRSEDFDRARELLAESPSGDALAGDVPD